jgi:hypothetical protein
MSIGNIRATPMVKLAAVMLALAAVVPIAIWTSRSLNDSPEEQAYGYFLRDVATVEAMGLQVYWLGRGFAVGYLTFYGPYGAEFGGHVQGAAIATYLAPLNGGNAEFRLTTYSRDAWELAKERTLNPKLPGVTHRQISMRDREAELVSVPLGTRPVNTLSLVLDLGDVVVVGVAGAGAPDEPPNPLINPDNLTALMEELRPYPQ